MVWVLAILLYIVVGARFIGMMVMLALMVAMHAGY